MASSTTQAPQGPVTVSDELGACEQSLTKAYSSFKINDRPATFDYQLTFLSDSDSKFNVTQLCDNGSVEAARTTPLFSGKMLDGSKLGTFNQYGLLCKTLAMRESQHLPESTTPKLPRICDYNPRIFLNVNTPWSTFICGSQGSGKSYSLSCILENCLIPSGLGVSSGVSLAATVGVRHKAVPRSSRMRLSVSMKAKHTLPSIRLSMTAYLEHATMGP